MLKLVSHHPHCTSTNRSLWTRHWVFSIQFKNGKNSLTVFTPSFWGIWFYLSIISFPCFITLSLSLLLSSLMSQVVHGFMIAQFMCCISSVFWHCEICLLCTLFSTADFCLVHLLLSRHPGMLYQHFVECVFHFNSFEKHKGISLCSSFWCHQSDNMSV